MLKYNVAEVSITKWASPIVVAPKDDGSLRYCICYRKLNAATVRDSYPFLQMNECINGPETANVFSTLDANSGYWQIELDENNIYKTVFVTHNKLYRYTCMSFGLKNTSATFQRAMNTILAPVKWQDALVYIYDVFIFFWDPRRVLESCGVHLTAGQQDRNDPEAKEVFFSFLTRVTTSCT